MTLCFTTLPKVLLKRLGIEYHVLWNVHYILITHIFTVSISMFCWYKFHLILENDMAA